MKNNLGFFVTLEGTVIRVLGIPSHLDLAMWGGSSFSLLFHFEALGNAAIGSAT